MTTAPAGPRPSVVTWGAAAGVVAGVLLVANAFDALASLRSLDSTAAINNTITQLGGRNGNFGDVVGLLRGAYIAVGAASGLAAVLAAYAGLGNRAARAALAPVAALVFVATASLGWTFGIAMAAVLGLLWSPPARAWYGGRPTVEPTVAEGALGSRQAPRFGAQRTRPRAVSVAVALTWVAAAMSLVHDIYQGVGIATSTAYLTRFEQQFPGLDQVPNAETFLRVVLLVGVVIGVVLALIEVVLAVFVLQGNRVARIVLTVFAGLGAISSLLSPPFGLLTLGPWILVLALLYSPDSKAWFEQIRRDRESR